MKNPLEITLIAALAVALAVTLAGMTGSGPAWAQDGPQTFEECAAVLNDAARLACFDEVATAKVPETVKKMKEAQIQEQKEEFGLFKLNPGLVLDELPVTFVAMRRDPYKKLILTTADGQVWRQTDTKTVYYPKQITGKIKKGMMGSFIFSPDTNDPAIKVKRIK